MKILGNRVLLEQLPPDTTERGFHLPTKYQVEQQLHRVLQLGTKVTEEGLAVGDIVLLNQYTINGRTPAGDNRWIIQVDDLCLAVGK